MIVSVAKNIEISSTSTESFEDAIRKGIERASKTVRRIEGAWIKEQKVDVTEGRIQDFRVMMVLTFIIDD